MRPTACPCSSGLDHDECCGPVLAGSRPARTAEQLMRSRYTAYVVGDVEHLRRTWHPTTRPTSLTLDDIVRWEGLDVVARDRGGPFDDEGTVEFRAHHRSGRDPGVLHELSRFVREGGQWYYVDGVAG